MNPQDGAPEPGAELMRRALDAAIAANRAKSEFLANMSHELRTPLNSIIGFAGVVLRNKTGQLQPQDAAYIQRIHDNGHHLLGLINSILDLSKVESGRLEVEYGDVDLGALLEVTLAELQGSLRDRPVALVADCPSGLASLRTDAGKLKQVLINLVGNALKFTEHGSVTLRVAADPRTARPARIDVIDTGIGIPADRQDAIFEAFQQADNSTARRYGGTGLGLTITRSLLQLLGYHVTLSSVVGVGSTFSVHLAEPAAPAAPNPAAAPAATAAPAETSSAPPLCVIHGPAALHDVLARRMREAGSDAAFGDPADIEAVPVTDRAPRMVVVGVPVPQMLGIERIEALRLRAAAQGVPTLVIGVVSSPKRGDIVAAAELLDQPVAPEALTATLWRQLEGPPSDAEERLSSILRRQLAAA